MKRAEHLRAFVVERYPDANLVARPDEDLDEMFGNENQDDDIYAAVIAGPQGPALSDFHVSGSEAWKEAAENLGYVEPSIDVTQKKSAAVTKGRIIEFPGRTQPVGTQPKSAVRGKLLQFPGSVRNSGIHDNRRYQASR